MTKPANISPLKQALSAQRKNLFRNGRFWFHILIWLIAACYLSFEILGDVFDKGVKDGMKTASAQSTVNSVPISSLPAVYICIFTVITAAIMVYSFLLFFIPYARLKKQKRFLWIGLISNAAFWVTIIILTAMMLGLTTTGTHGNIDKQLNKDNLFLSGLISTIFSGIVAGGFFALYYFIDLYDQSRQLFTYKEALTKRIEAETAFLLHQINPHFLFNTLNNIYALLLSQSPDAVFITKELKNMTQYILEDCSKEKVKLTDEITFLKNYINLEKLRNREDQVNIRLIVTGDAEGKEIAPLLLINFLENAFKHGVKAGFNESYVSIVLEIKANKLILQMENSKPPRLETENKSIKEDSGIGIANVKRRLDILYPGRYKLAIQNNPNEYLVLLSIEL
ncbi:GHKL domain-containing protein [Taibaiella lutea]|uniref:GHKL domain-containing protein n=1 Tax=Taibaiella lutea TaxID=2608001 RepID=A0A5M6CM58_9BACT|nr:histidine kinase [Taibaiella lutea]KAA5535062.1 GHKL domain-containing protein [Taibaiella lutea]